MLDAHTESTLVQDSPSLEQIIARRFNDIPQEEWDRLADDLIDDLDHYTADADRR